MSKRLLIQYSMLKYFVRHGVVVEKAHEVIWFEQSRWLKTFTDFNANKRAAAQYDFARYLLKKWIDISMVNQWKTLNTG